MLAHIKIISLPIIHKLMLLKSEVYVFAGY